MGVIIGMDPHKRSSTIKVIDQSGRRLAVGRFGTDTEGRAYFDRKKASGKTSMEAMRCLKRRLSDIVYRTMLGDFVTGRVTGPGG